MWKHEKLHPRGLPAAARQQGSESKFPMSMKSIQHGILLLVVFLACGCRGRPPKKLFQALIVDPVPKSVQILHGREDDGLDMVAYLHFTIAPEDLPKILQSRKWTQKKKINRDDYDAPMYAPSWWTPKELKNPTLYRWEEQTASGGPIADAELWVDESEGEVYFTYGTF